MTIALFFSIIQKSAAVRNRKSGARGGVSRYIIWMERGACTRVAQYAIAPTGTRTTAAIADKLKCATIRGKIFLIFFRGIELLEFIRSAFYRALGLYG